MGLSVGSFNYYISPYMSGSSVGATNTAINNRLNGLSPVGKVGRVPGVVAPDETAKVTGIGLHFDSAKSDTVLSGRLGNEDDTEQYGIKPDSKDTDKVPGGKVDPEDCETCKNRKYVDGSNDANVSFKTPGHISPSASASVVMGHEMEHVANAVSEGMEDNKKLVSSTVTLKTAICPECGTSYVSGGVTRTNMLVYSESPAAKVQKANEAYGKTMKGSPASGFDMAV